MPHQKNFFHTASHKQASTYRHTYSRQKKLPDLTEGPIFAPLLSFCLPLILTNLLQVFYNAADMMVVSLSSEPNAVGAIGITGSFVTLVINLLLGFSTGANVVVARHLGANDADATARATHTSLLIALLFGVLSGAVGIAVSRPILSLMGATGSLLSLAVTYTRIYFLGVPFLALTNYLSAIFRAKGDTRTPLYVLSASGLINVALNLCFVLALGLSVEGVAIATVIANLFSTVALLYLLSRDDSPCRFSPRALRFDADSLKKILYVGLPAGIQGSLFSISNILIQSSILSVNALLCPAGSAYDAVVNGNAAASNLEGFIYTAQNAVYQAAITFTAQNVGANKHRRIFPIMGHCYLLGSVISLFLGCSIFLVRNPLLALYGVRNGAIGSLANIAYVAAYERMLYLFLPFFTLSLMEVGTGVLRGLGKSVSSMIISLIGACLFRVAWIAWVFPRFMTLKSIFISYPISWCATAIVSFVLALLVLRKWIRQEEA